MRGDRTLDDPKAPGDRVKTDSATAGRLARLHRAGELMAIRVQTSRRRRSRTMSGRPDTMEDLTWAATA